MTPKQNDKIEVEITGAKESHCFRLILQPQLRSGCCDAPIEEWATGDAYCSKCRKALGPAQQRIEILLHAITLVDLIHKCSLALCQWQRQTSQDLILRISGLTEEQAREKGLIA